MSSTVRLDFGGLLLIMTVAMAVLKLAGVIAWSWWLVFLPVLVPFGVLSLIFIVTFIVGVFVMIIAYFAEK